MMGALAVAPLERMARQFSDELLDACLLLRVHALETMGLSLEEALLFSDQRAFTEQLRPEGEPGAT